MAVAQPFRRLPFGWRVAVLTVLSALVNTWLYSSRVAMFLQAAIGRWLPVTDAGEVAYVAFIVRTLFIGIGLLALLALVIRVERPSDIRAFLKLGPIDWPGIGLLFLFLGVINAAESVFLRRAVYDPLRSWIDAAGIPAVMEPPLRPDPHLVWLNLALLLLIVWVEAPEELFFRGYVQHHLQERVGPGAALAISAVAWDAWHLFDPAGFVRRLLFGLALGLVFRLRQNTTPLAVGHPMANRLLLAVSMLSPLFRGS